MPKTLTVRIDDATYRLIAEAAEVENRSVSNFIETAAREKAVAEIFIPDDEMAEIRSDPDLQRRLKSGHKDAASRRGRAGSAPPSNAASIPFFERHPGRSRPRRGCGTGNLRRGESESEAGACSMRSTTTNRSFS